MYPTSVHATPDADLAERDLPQFLAQYPGPLAEYHDGTQTAAGSIRSACDYYGVSVRVMVALLEASNHLVTEPTYSDAQLQSPVTAHASAPTGFAAQIDWAAAQLRAGMGPYTHAPVLTFTDGLTATVNLNQAPEGVAVQRLLAIGRTNAQWVMAVTDFVNAFTLLFQDELVQVAPRMTPTVTGFLQRPWQSGVRVRHLAYFDHQYPTVDTQASDDGVVVTYRGVSDVQYDGHDGHDYAFPDQLIGTPILAAADGIAFASTHRGNGVYIQHADGYTTVYWHLDRFSRRFSDLIDSGHGVAVRAGDVIGSSGRSGFVRGTPHLHFEVRRYGKQVDPYGWYGTGSDPCLRYAACTTSTWLWSNSLRGEFDFTPPNELIATAQLPQYRMVVSPRRDIALLASFDDSLAPELSTTALVPHGDITRIAGRHGQAIQLQRGAYLEMANTDSNATQGAISVWVDARAAPTGRHTVFASRAQSNPGTIALDFMRSTDGRGTWVLWSVDDDGVRSEVRVAARVDGYQHVTALWQREGTLLQLYLDGVLAATTAHARIPTHIGDMTSFGRSLAEQVSNLSFDELVVWRDLPTSRTLRELALSEETPTIQAPIDAQTTQLTVQLIPPATTLDPVVMMRVDIDGHATEPIPLTTRFAIALPPAQIAIDEHLSEISVVLMSRGGAVQTLKGVVVRPMPYIPAVSRAYR